jgi:hypothetical protein
VSGRRGGDLAAGVGITLRRSFKEGGLLMVTSCPFCGLGTDLPHETQQACIAALHAEIARMRQVVDRLNVLSDVPLSGNGPNAPAGAEDR